MSKNILIIVGFLFLISCKNEKKSKRIDLPGEGYVMPSVDINIGNDKESYLLWHVEKKDSNTFDLVLAQLWYNSAKDINGKEELILEKMPIQQGKYHLGKNPKLGIGVQFIKEQKKRVIGTYDKIGAEDYLSIEPLDSNKVRIVLDLNLEPKEDSDSQEGGIVSITTPVPLEIEIPTVPRYNRQRVLSSK